jgi:hypothetical protein
MLKHAEHQVAFRGLKIAGSCVRIACIHDQTSL